MVSFSVPFCSVVDTKKSDSIKESPFGYILNQVKIIAIGTESKAQNPYKQEISKIILYFSAGLSRKNIVYF
ncbi:hypothetical protein RsTz2092_12910 [Deferribacterales bacterium RsTz2092]